MCRNVSYNRLAPRSPTDVVEYDMPSSGRCIKENATTIATRNIGISHAKFFFFKNVLLVV
jgi:hypothetical protein